MFQFHVPLCCLWSGNKLSDSQAKVEKLNQSPKCGYYYCYTVYPFASASNFNNLVFNRSNKMESEEKIKLWFFQLWFHRDYDSIYYSNFLFSPGHRQSYKTAQDLFSQNRTLDCRAGGRRFDSWGWTNTLGLKITEKYIRYCLCLAKGQTSRGSDDHVKWRACLQYETYK